MINAQSVKELRELTGAGMMDCKKALVATNGNFEEAITWLREKGIAKAQKKASRVAAEGVCTYRIQGNKAVVFELNSETDFVAKNDNFTNLVTQISDAIINSDVTTTEEALKIVVNGFTINDLIIDATAKIGEKITLRRVNVFEKTDNQVFGVYSHMQGRIVSLVVLEGNNEEVAKDVSMHIAAMNPQYLREDEVDPTFIEKEKEILTQEALNEGKPANIVERMVVGRIKKYLKEICLEDQIFVKNQDQTVLQYVKAYQSKIIKYIRLEVGEGIEK